MTCLHDDAGWVASITHNGSNGSILAMGYTYTADGLIDTISETWLEGGQLRTALTTYT